MEAALEQAKLALEEQEVPIGAVVVRENVIIGRGYNKVEQYNDPTGHAEILALREAGLILGNWRLSGCRLYVTVEPCVMCLGAILSARVEELIYALIEPKSGAIRSRKDMVGLWLGKNLSIVEGVKKRESLALLQNFFEQIRDKKKGRGTEVWP